MFSVIADERRRKILRLIRSDELSAGEIADHFDVTQPAISQHLKILVESGLVTVRQQGTRRFFRARPEGLMQVREFLEAFWDESLQELKRAAENEKKGSDHHGNN